MVASRFLSEGLASHNATLTLSLAVALGVFLTVIARRLGVPSIVLLLSGGVLLGPQGVGVIHPADLGPFLETVVSLAVAVILFEGGLTLDVAGYRRSSTAIRRLLTVGPLVTWFGTALTVRLLFELSWGMALMAGSLVIVTGPTVISPLLRRMRIRERLHHALYWESVLVDAVGVLVAVLCFEFLTSGMVDPLGRFGLRLLVGVSFGVGGGLALSVLLGRGLIPEEHVNLFVLAMALLVFGAAHDLLSEAGILAVVVAGLVLRLRPPPRLGRLETFKLQLTELSVAVVFVLLSAQLDLSNFNDPRLIAFLAVVMLVLRPLVIFLSTWGQGFSLPEKALLSWMAPRGIVAAGMASLVTLRLQESGHPGAAVLETFTYAVIGVTVMVQGLTAPWIARILGLGRGERGAWLLAGEPVFVEALSRGLHRAGVAAVTIAPDEEDGPPPGEVEAVLCAHGTLLQNVWFWQRWAPLVGREKCHRWASRRADPAERDVAGEGVWETLPSAADVAHGLTAGEMTVDVLEVGEQDAEGRFGPNVLPLFWVSDHVATLVRDPESPGHPHAELAVVLTSRVEGLADLVRHVEVIDGTPDFETIVERLVASATRHHPDLDSAALAHGILDRHGTMSAAVGAGVAIPHAYTDVVDHSVCFLGAIPNGVDLGAPDGEPVKLVFMVLSPVGSARAHLDSLAALAHLAQDGPFLELLARQRVPDRMARLIAERAR